MLSNVFIDTDIILDVVIDRKGFYESSSKIFQLFENGKAKLFTSPTIIINAQYTGQKFISKEKCRATINYLLHYFIILEANSFIIRKAYQSNFSDVEDAIQYYTAIQNNDMDYFLTRNVKDFKPNDKKLSVVTPVQYLKLIK